MAASEGAECFSQTSLPYFFSRGKLIIIVVT